MDESIVRKVGTGALAAVLASALMLPSAAFAQPADGGGAAEAPVTAGQVQEPAESGGDSQGAAAAAAETDGELGESPDASDDPVTIVVELRKDPAPSLPANPFGFFMHLFSQSGDTSHQGYRDRIHALEAEQVAERAADAPQADPQAQLQGQAAGAARAKAAQAPSLQLQSLQGQEDAAANASGERDYYNVIDGFTVQAPASLLDQIKAMDGVANAFVSQEHPAPLDAGDQGGVKNASSLGMTGADAVSQTGKGQAIAVVDTGVMVDHEGFKGSLPEGSAKYDEAAITEVKAQLGEGADGVYVSEKIPFAYDYAMHDSDVADGAGHGTHVAGIAAANAGDVRGTAPNAQIIAMKVSSDNGAIYDDALLAALDDCAKFDLAAVNVSIGADGGFSGDAQDTMANAVNALEASGTVVNVAAGNSASSAQSNRSGKNLPFASDPDSGTISSPASAAQSTAVASVNNVEGAPYFTLADGTAVEYQYAVLQEDNSIWPTLDALEDGEYELADELQADMTGSTGANNAGKIAIVERGGVHPYTGSPVTFGRAIYNVSSTHPAAIIIYDNVDGDAPMKMSLDDYATWPSEKVPCVSVTKASGALLKAAAAAGQKVALKAGRVSEPSTDYAVSDFSSWGATPDLALKPDIAAPGGNINSTTNDGKYGYMSGTSMATPQMTGISAQMREYVDSDAKFEGLDAGQKSDVVSQLLMSTAKPLRDLRAEGGWYSPRQQGAGLANVPAALGSDVYLTVDGAADAAHPKAELGESASGVWSFSVTLHNLGDVARTYEPGVVALSDQISDGLFQQRSVDWAGKGIAVTYGGAAYADGAVSVPAHGSATYTVTLTCEDAFKSAMAEAANGTFVDGFAMLAGSDGAPDLSVPFMGFYGDWDDAPIFDGKLGTSDAHLWGSYLEADGFDGPLGFNPLDYDSIYDYNNGTNMSPRGDWRQYYHPDRLVTSASADYKAPSTVSTRTYLQRGAAEFQWGFSQKGSDEGIQAYYRAYLKKSRTSTNSAFPIMTAEDVAGGYASFSFTGLDEGWYQVSEDAVVAGDQNAEPQSLVYDIYYDKTAPAVGDVLNTEGEDAKVTFRVTDASWLAGVTVQTYPVYAVSTNESIKTFLDTDLDMRETVDDQGNYVYDISIPISALKQVWTASSERSEADMPNTLALVAWDWGMNPSEPVKAVLNPVPATGLTLSQQQLTVAPGQNATLEAALSPDDTTDDAIDWASSDESVAVVDSAGKVTGVSVGTAQITATVHGREVSAGVQVNVKNISNKTGVLLSDDLVRVRDGGGEGTLSAILSPKLAGATVNWATSDEDVASIEVDDANPNAIRVFGGYQVGVATISATVSAGGNVYSAEAQVRNWPDDYEDFVIDDAGELTAYQGASLSIQIPNDVKEIGEGVFADKRATEFRIPASVERIGKDAFLNTSARSVAFEDTEEHPSRLVEVGEHAFANLTNGQIGWSSIRFPESVTTLGAGVMEGKSCERIYVPAGVTVIPDRAFTGTHGEVWIGDDVTWIGDEAFSTGGPQAMMFGALYIIGREDEQAALGDSLLPSKLEHIGANAFSTTEVFLNIDMPAGVTFIGDGAFASASQSIHNNGGPTLGLTLNEGLVHIGESAFSGTRITGLAIPDSVVELGDYAFGSVGTLQKVKIGKNVEAKALGRAFVYSDSIVEYEVADDCANYTIDDQGIVYSKDKTAVVAFPMGKKDPDYVIPEGVTRIASGAFDAYDGSFLDFCQNYPKSISLPDSLEVIERGALNTYIERLELGPNVKQVAEGAFADVFGNSDLNPSVPAHLVIRGGDGYSVASGGNAGYYHTSYFGPGVSSIDFSGGKTSDMLVVNSDTLDSFAFDIYTWPDWYEDPIAIYAKKGTSAWDVIKQKLTSGAIDFGYYYDGWCADDEDNQALYDGARKPIMHDYEPLEVVLLTDDEVVAGETVQVEAAIEGGIGQKKLRWFVLDEQGRKTYVASEAAPQAAPAQASALSAAASEGQGLVAASVDLAAGASTQGDAAEAPAAGEWSDATAFTWTVPSDGSQLYVEVMDDSYYSLAGTFVDTPVWDEQPASVVAHQGDDAVTLRAKASVGDGQISYQWFKASCEDFSDAKPMGSPEAPDADGATQVTVTADELGSAYYRVKAVNTVARWDQTSSSLTGIAKFEVLPVDSGELESAIAAARELLNGGQSGKLGSDARKQLEQALEQAEALAALGSAKQADIQDMAKALVAAVSQARDSAAGSDDVKPAPATEQPKVGAQVSAGSGAAKATYAIAKLPNGKKAGTVWYVKPASKAVKKVSVPATVKISGATYKVIGVKAKAFKGCSKLTTVRVGKNVATIGKSAFAGCKNLKSVVLGKSVKKVGKNAFKGCSKLKKVTVKSGKLTKASVKNIVKGSKVKTLKIKGKAAKAKQKAYKRAAGKKVRVK